MITFFMTWFLVMAPIVVTPGPINLACAMSGVKQGVSGSIGFLLGVDLTIILLSTLVGLGLGEILLQNPVLYRAAKWLGLLYLCYLTYKFARHPMIAPDMLSDSSVQYKDFKFIDGVLLQSLNPKGWVMMVTMFSVFMDGSIDQSLQLPLLIVWLSLLNVITHFLWVVAGHLIADYVQNERMEKVIRYSLSATILIVVIWLAVFDQ